MRLSIIIPSYNPNPADLLGLLASIRIQLAVDFEGVEVIIVNDAGAPLPKGLCGMFSPLKIRKIDRTKRGGPGMARQSGIDAAQGEYVMFCDADDTLHNVGVLSAIRIELEQGDHPDILLTKWIEEVRQKDGTYIYTTHDADWTWMHGKVIRRDFIASSGVRHHPELLVHEDSYFLNVLSSHSPKVRSCDVISYVWRWHDGSITRRNSSEYSFKSLPYFLHAVSLADAEILKIDPALMPERIAYRACYIYHLLGSPEWRLKEHAADRQATEEAFRKEVSPFWNYWKEAPEGVKQSVYHATMGFSCGAIPDESLSGWLKRIGMED